MQDDYLREHVNQYSRNSRAIQVPFSAIYMELDTATMPCRLQVLTSPPDVVEEYWGVPWTFTEVLTTHMIQGMLACSNIVLDALGSFPTNADSLVFELLYLSAF